MTDQVTGADSATPAAEPLALRSNDLLGPWQPIETAPRDGAEVLVCRVYENGKAEYAVAHNYGDGNGWRDMGDLGWSGMVGDEDNQPTHWMQLQPPKHPEQAPQCSAARFDAFRLALDDLCMRHGIQLSTSQYDGLQAWPLRDGEPPVYSNGFENRIPEGPNAGIQARP